MLLATTLRTLRRGRLKRTTVPHAIEHGHEAVGLTTPVSASVPVVAVRSVLQVTEQVFHAVMMLVEASQLVSKTVLDEVDR